MDDVTDYTEYVQARWPALVRSAIVLGCDFEEAHDLAQVTLIRCYTSWRKVQRARDRDAYVFRILLNCHRDSRRRRWWGERPSDLIPSGVIDTSDDPAAEIEVADAVRRAMADLDHGQRVVVVLRYFANLSEAQTAEFLGIKPGTVKSRLARALARMAASPHLSDHIEGA